jgi:hypothetical protein
VQGVEEMRGVSLLLFPPSQNRNRRDEMRKGVGHQKMKFRGFPFHSLPVLPPCFARSRRREEEEEKKKRRTGSGEKGARTSKQQYNQHPLNHLLGVYVALEPAILKRWMHVCLNVCASEGCRGQRREQRKEEERFPPSQNPGRP